VFDREACCRIVFEFDESVDRWGGVMMARYGVGRETSDEEVEIVEADEVA
jgi:hypothetical protein